jgi:predicted nucleic acid-binding protein
VTLVVDASIAAKWILPEDGSDVAGALRGKDDFIAPSLIVPELGNAIWKRAVRGELSARDAIVALESAINVFTRLVPTVELAVRATEMAIELRHPIYDCFYLALAERERCALITADGRLIAVAKRIRGVELRRL